MEILTTGQLAQKAQVNVETVRYYERRGLLPEPPRRESGYRLYSSNDVARIRFIKRAQELGFSLREILELLSLRVDAKATPIDRGRLCGDIKKRAEAKVADIEEKIRALQEIKAALTKLMALCSGSGPTSECPILEALNSENR